MSMIHCDDCSRLIDSDNDPDCFILIPGVGGDPTDHVACEPCRDSREAERDRADNACAEAEDRATFDNVAALARELNGGEL